jgi:hypothetical protein
MRLSWHRARDTSSDQDYNCGMLRTGPSPAAPPPAMASAFASARLRANAHGRAKLAPDDRSVVALRLAVHRHVDPVEPLEVLGGCGRLVLGDDLVRLGLGVHRRLVADLPVLRARARARRLARTRRVDVLASRTRGAVAVGVWRRRCKGVCGRARDKGGGRRGRRDRQLPCPPGTRQGGGDSLCAARRWRRRTHPSPHSEGRSWPGPGLRAPGHPSRRSRPRGPSPSLRS